MHCTKCGAAVPGTVKFCTACGTPAAVASAGASPTTMQMVRLVRRVQQWIARLQQLWRTTIQILQAEHPQSWWDALAMIGGGALGSLWALVSLIRGVPGGLQTGGLIALLPVVLTLARKPIDKLLMPLQKVREALPRWVLIAAALVAPFGLVTILLQLGVGLLNLPNQYVTQAAMIVGTMMAHALLRTPEDAELQPASKPATAARAQP